MQNVSSCKDSAADMNINHEIMKTTFFNKPPHAIVLISGDSDFVMTINFLESAGYTVFLIHCPVISEGLQKASKNRFLWLDVLGIQKTDPVTLGPVLMDGKFGFKDRNILCDPNDRKKNSEFDSSDRKNISDLRFVPVVQELKNLKINCLKTEPFSDIPKKLLLKCGFTSSVDFIDRALKKKVLFY